jgi:hypothetical protein
MGQKLRRKGRGEAKPDHPTQKSTARHPTGFYGRNEPAQLSLVHLTPSLSVLRIFNRVERRFTRDDNASSERAPTPWRQ